MMQGTVKNFTLSFLLATSALGLAACDDSPSSSAAGGSAAMMGQMPPASVSVVEIQPERVTLTAELSGRTVAYRQAEVRPQVSGILQQRLFEEGSVVTEGQQLYQIDPATYQASIESAEAALAKAEANLKAVESKAERYARLVKSNAVSRQDYNDIKASLDQAKAEVLSAQAAQKTAKINLDYTRVCAPISGRTGKSAISEGALVTANQSNFLTTITQLDPIYVDLTQSSSDMAKLRRALMGGQMQHDTAPNAATGVTLVPDDVIGDYGLKGELQFSEVTVDPSTGNVQLRAVFPNPDMQLLPGLFVRARIETGVKDHALLVPQQSVVRQPDGSAIVWVVGEDSTVSPRPVTVGDVVGARWIIEQVLTSGDRVVTEGIQKVRPGAKVDVGTPSTPEPVPDKGVSASEGSRQETTNQE